jgi:AraC family transcriptional regulator, transcriptional activator of the genes for pyochelin and ferripyochelin receptors
MVMALTIVSEDYDALFEAMWEQSYCLDPEDEADVVIPYPQQLGTGQVRTIELSEGLCLRLESYQQYQDIAVAMNEHPDQVRIGFHLSGFHRGKLAEVCPGEYALSGRGIVPQEVFDSLAIKPVHEIEVLISTAQLQSFFGELPLALHPLLNRTDQLPFATTARITPAIQVALQQVLNCPYQGILKQRYLETKIWELLILVVEPLLAVHNTAPSRRKSPEQMKQIAFIPPERSCSSAWITHLH